MDLLVVSPGPYSERGSLYVPGRKLELRSLDQAIQKNAITKMLGLMSKGRQFVRCATPTLYCETYICMRLGHCLNRCVNKYICPIIIVYICV